jgi:hypothetical protein
VSLCRRPFLLLTVRRLQTSDPHLLFYTSLQEALPTTQDLPVFVLYRMLGRLAHRSKYRLHEGALDFARLEQIHSGESWSRRNIFSAIPLRLFMPACSEQQDQSAEL